MEDFLRRFRVAHHQPAAVDERVVEAVDDSLDRLLLEVDEDVAAHHEIHAVGDVLGRRVVVVHEVEARELHHPADLRRELEAVLVEAGEVLVLYVLRHLAEGPVAVEARVCLLERSVVDVRAVWRRAAVAVLPSTYGEGVPKALLEAAACARPIVASDVAGCREVVRPGDNGILVPPRDVKGLADAIAGLACDPVRRRAMGRAGRALVERDFGEDTVARETLALYESALREKAVR